MSLSFSRTPLTFLVQTKQPLGVLQMNHGQRGIVFMHPGLENAGHSKPPHLRNHPGWRGPDFRCENRDRITRTDAQLGRQTGHPA